jgi:hypothetical protein
MNRRYLTSVDTLAIVFATALLAPALAAAQSAQPAATTAAKTSSVPRMPDGRPDLQGVWDFRTITPMERPKALGTKAFFTAEEAAAFEKDENHRQNRDLIDPEKGGLDYPARGVIPYNEFWYDRGNKIVGTRRTSLIVDPPDGRFPALTAEGQKRAAERAEWARANQLGRSAADSYEDRTLSERCLMGLNAGPPMHPGPYNNNFQMFQTPEFVAIQTEMIHDARVVPLDGRPHISMRQWKGDSRGHWEGDTLVVDTTNLKRETSFPGSSAHTHVIERFTRTDDKTLLYEFTVDDPTMWTRPWTAAIPMTKIDEPIYEFACHEGNHALLGILAGARVQEKADEERAKKGAK